VLLASDWHQRRPNNDAEIIDQALQVRDLTGKTTLLASCDYRQLYRAAAACLLRSCRVATKLEPGKQ
jgi:hypothetical protein